MENCTNSYLEIYEYLIKKYHKISLTKKELAVEMGISPGALDLYMARKVGCPKYKKLGKSKNAKVLFNVLDVAQFLSTGQVQTM
jgi:hypothetical protein